jgi:hypothetical protein
MPIAFPERMRDEVEWHIKIHDEITRRHQSGDRNFFLFLHVDVRNLDTDAATSELDTEGRWLDDLDRDLTQWLTEVDPDNANEPSRWTWDRAGLHFRVSAIPKKPEARGRSTVLFANSLPVMTWFVGERWATL